MFANNEKINIKNTLELNSLNSNKKAKIKIIFIKEKNTIFKWFKIFDKPIDIKEIYMKQKLLLINLKIQIIVYHVK